MKTMTTLFEAILEKVEAPGSTLSTFFVVIIVLVLGAGSLYVLLNTQA